MDTTKLLCIIDEMRLLLESAQAHASGDDDKFANEIETYLFNLDYDIEQAKTSQSDSTSVWTNAKEKDKLPKEGERIIRYQSEVNSGEVSTAVTICDSRVLKHSDEHTWWANVPELPVPLKVF